MEMILLYVTCADKVEAKKIAQVLMKEKRIACANMYPITAIYPWEGKIEDGEEYILLLKTVEEKYDGVVTRVKELHSFDVPCILKIDITPNKEYEKWVKEQIVEKI
jgi:periplasmic divalent cation tolerance protein